MARSVVKGSVADLGPFRWGLVAASAALLPVSAVLLDEYHEASDRHFAKQLPVTPSASALAAGVGSVCPALAGAELDRIYQAQPSPRNGVLSVYRLQSGGKMDAMVVVLRHDILCASCRDVLLAVVLDPLGQEIEAVVNLVPWEVDGKRVDSAPFLAQWSGRPVGDVVRVGEIDGITGATRSVHAVVDELAALSSWRQEHAALFGE